MTQADRPLPESTYLEVVEALTDMLNGWKYIRHSHGDLYGVGWDRAQQRVEAALVSLQALSPAQATLTDMQIDDIAGEVDARPGMVNQSSWERDRAFARAAIQGALQPGPPEMTKTRDVAGILHFLTREQMAEELDAAVDAAMSASTTQTKGQQ
jgi:hypothetical protein